MAEPETPVPPAAPVKKGKAKLVIVAVAVLLVIGGGGGFWGFTYWRAQAAKPKEEGPTAKIKSILNLEPFLVNLADADAARFLKVTFRLGLGEPGLGEEYGSDPIIISATRDRILSLLSTKTAEDLLSPEGKDRLRIEIKEKLAPILPNAKIIEVFILDFVVQL